MRAARVASGLGITGLADALVMMRQHYGSDQSLAIAQQTMRLICRVAYRASIELAKGKASFPYFERDRYLQSPFIRSLPDNIQRGITEHGIRNSHLLAIAPTGTISLLAGNVSSGLEPIFAASYRRKILHEAGIAKDFLLTDYAIGLWRAGVAKGLPNGFCTASELPVRAHLDMQATLQPFIDNSISKTINVPETYPFHDFQRRAVKKSKGRSILNSGDWRPLPAALPAALPPARPAVLAPGPRCP
jgi:ribonucleoside-diphosphate reductase alpha chain